MEKELQNSCNRRDLSEPILCCARAGNEEMLKWLDSLQDASQDTSRDNRKWYVCCLAYVLSLQHAHESLVEYLYTQKGLSSYYFFLPNCLVIAAEYGYLQAVESLGSINRDDYYYTTRALYKALGNGHRDVVSRLAKKYEMEELVFLYHTDCKREYTKDISGLVEAFKRGDEQEAVSIMEKLDSSEIIEAISYGGCRCGPQLFPMLRVLPTWRSTSMLRLCLQEVSRRGAEESVRNLFISCEHSSILTEIPGSELPDIFLEHGILPTRGTVDVRSCICGGLVEELDRLLQYKGRDMRRFCLRKAVELIGDKIYDHNGYIVSERGEEIVKVALKYADNDDIQELLNEGGEGIRRWMKLIS
jgi:hypothetical protein